MEHELPESDSDHKLRPVNLSPILFAQVFEATSAAEMTKRITFTIYPQFGGRNSRIKYIFRWRFFLSKFRASSSLF